ncbi:MAG: PilT/PilU family type 4a pilus ATPase [Planctomycetota bacterium]|nr:PilT/PilU family type 4a pilus ATPase [Planctomycetota bacterium]
MLKEGMTIDRLLQKMGELEASDLHIKVGSPPVIRIASKLHRIDAPEMNGEDTRKLLQPILPDHLLQDLDQKGGIDFSHRREDLSRFRCNVFSSGGELHAAIRRVNDKIPNYDELNLPPIYSQVMEGAHEGIIVVCGVTGSGKSSTLAAMINHINKTRQVNIITIEDPIEYAYKAEQSYISQREIGIDTEDFSSALRSVVRQDPDVIMIGELRDRETVLAGIQAAETGHLVFVTLHTSDTMQAFARMLEFFPQKEHSFIRSSLANSLVAVMAQRLVPSLRKDIQLIPVTEVLINNTTVSDRIRDGADDELPLIMAGSLEEGMHDFTYSLTRLINENYLDLRTAVKYAPNVEALRARVKGIEVKADVLVSKGR